MLSQRRRRLMFLACALVTVFLIWYLNFPSDLKSLASKATYTKSAGRAPTAPASNLNDSLPKTTTDAMLAPKPVAEPQDEGFPTRLTKGTYIADQYKFVEKFPVKDYISFRNAPPLKLPRLQHDFDLDTHEGKATRLKRLEAIKASFERSWDGYKNHAWMQDELSPLDGGSTSTFGGRAATLVDTLDTLWIMGMEDEFKNALDAVKNINFSSSESDVLNVFETTIRYLGGFLGAYDVSDGKYPVLLQKAVEVGDFLYCAFDTPNRMPNTRWKWKEALEGATQTADENTLIAEIGSLTLEFTRLSQLTGDLKYYDAVQRITDELDKAQSITKLPGLWPIVVNAKSTNFQNTDFTLGGMTDSVYEYLPKQYMLLGGSSQMEKMYNNSINAAKNHIFFRPMVPGNKDILISGDAQVQETSGTNARIISQPKGQHLGCFVGGMVSIGAKIFKRPAHIELARKLIDGCIWTYDSMPSGIMPEVFHMVACDVNHQCNWTDAKWHKAILERAAAVDHEDKDMPQFKDDAEKIRYFIGKDRLKPGFTAYSDTSYGLRPEAIESVFIHYRLTGETDLLDAAWRMFVAIEQQTRTEYAYATISDVRIKDSEKRNRMESFWLAETLKYFYLIFSEPDVVSLDDYVLNTEAHQFKRPSHGGDGKSQSGGSGS